MAKHTYTMEVEIEFEYDEDAIALTDATDLIDYYATAKVELADDRVNIIGATLSTVDNSF